MTSQSHRASRCGTLWIKIEASQSYQLKGLSGDSSQNAHHGEVDGGKDFVEQLRAILQESEAKLEMKIFNLPSFFVWR